MCDFYNLYKYKDTGRYNGFLIIQGVWNVNLPKTAEQTTEDFYCHSAALGTGSVLFVHLKRNP